MARLAPCGSVIPITLTVVGEHALPSSLSAAARAWSQLPPRRRRRESRKERLAAAGAAGAAPAVVPSTVPSFQLGLAQAPAAASGSVPTPGDAAPTPAAAAAAAAPTGPTLRFRSASSGVAISDPTSHAGHAAPALDEPAEASSQDRPSSTSNDGALYGRPNAEEHAGPAGGSGAALSPTELGYLTQTVLEISRRAEQVV